MDRDCVCEGTIVTGKHISHKIETLEPCKEYVFGYDQKTSGLEAHKQSAFLYKGVRDCVEVTLRDGRKVECTPDHPFLTSDNRWIRANDLTPNDKLKVGIVNPLVNYEEEIRECEGYELRVGNLTFETDTVEELKKTLAFSRILGYILTDGTIRETGGISVCLGHELDAEAFLEDIELITDKSPKIWIDRGCPNIHIPSILGNEIQKLPGIMIGRRTVKHGSYPEFLTDDDCPKPILREFLGGLFGGDGYAPCLRMAEGKRNIFSSVGFTQNKREDHLPSLQIMFEDIQRMLNRFGITKCNINTPHEDTPPQKREKKVSQNIMIQPVFNIITETPLDPNTIVPVFNIIKLDQPTTMIQPVFNIIPNEIQVQTIFNIITDETTVNVRVPHDKTIGESVKEIIPLLNEKTGKKTLNISQDAAPTEDESNLRFFGLKIHIEVDQLVDFAEKIGFRYCCHKSQRLSVAVSYRKLRDGVVKQNNWITERTNQLTNYRQRKIENPNCKVSVKRFYDQAVSELTQKEVILNECSIPTKGSILGYLRTGSTCGSFRNDKFSTAGDYAYEIGALDSFLADDNDDGSHKTAYGVNRSETSLPTFNLQVIDVRPIGKKKVYDIQVDNVHSFLANGVVAHNCMISHGAPRMMQERLCLVSDAYEVAICARDGCIAVHSPAKNLFECRICGQSDMVGKLTIPFVFKLLIHYMEAVGIRMVLEVEKVLSLLEQTALDEVVPPPMIDVASVHTKQQFYTVYSEKDLDLWQRLNEWIRKEKFLHCRGDYERFVEIINTMINIQSDRIISDVEIYTALRRAYAEISASPSYKACYVPPRPKTIDDLTPGLRNMNINAVVNIGIDDGGEVTDVIANYLNSPDYVNSLPVAFRKQIPRDHIFGLGDVPSESISYNTFTYATKKPKVKKIAAGDVSLEIRDVSWREGSLPFPDESVDIIFMLRALPKVQKPSKLLSEIHRVLTPTGRFIIRENDINPYALSMIVDLRNGLKEIVWPEKKVTQLGSNGLVEEKSDAEIISNFINNYNTHYRKKEDWEVLFREKHFTRLTGTDELERLYHTMDDPYVLGLKTGGDVSNAFRTYTAIYQKDPKI
jgi:intein/homing endonuclease/SAM-dependent methyltransferase